MAGSAAREDQPERRHLLAVANQQDVSNHHRMVPGFALDRLEPRELSELLRRRSDERQLAFLGRHEQQVLIGQQDQLTVAVSSTLPFALTVLEVKAREDAAVEAECVTSVNDEVVEVRLQCCRRPTLL